MSKEEIIIGLYSLAPLIIAGITAAIILLISAGGESRSGAGRLKAVRTAEKLSYLAFAVMAFISAVHFIKIKGPLTLFHNAIFFDHYSAAAGFIFSIMGIFTVSIAAAEMKSESSRFQPEYYALLLSAAVGSLIMAMANDLLAAIVGIEILSFSTYILCALDNKNKRAVEGAFKYFLTGAAAGALFLFGMAHIYGGAQTTLISQIPAMAAANAQGPGPGAPLLIGLVFITSALLFKAAAVPFHSWAPDAYDAAAISVAAFMTYFVKAAVFILIFRIFAAAFIFMAPSITGVLNVIAVLTMTVANIAALYQNNIKRMLAYSSISHTAYILIAVICSAGVYKNAAECGAYIIFYLVSYFFINTAIFSALAMLSPGETRVHTIEDLKGLGFKKPFFSAALSLALLALAGIPATSGFIAKFLIFYNAFLLNYHALVLLAVINSLIAFYYYIKIIMAMYMQKPEPGETAVFFRNARRESAICLAISSALIIILGVYPDFLIKLARLAVTCSF